MFNNNLLMGAASAGGTSLVEVGNSALFTGSTPNLQITNGTPTSTTKWSFSLWFYRGSNYTTGANQVLISDDDGNYWALNMSDVDKLEVWWDGSSNEYKSEQVFRDIGWYHCVVATDTSQATVSNRLKVYINGEQITMTITNSAVSQKNETANIGTDGGKIMVGSLTSGGPRLGFQGYFSEFCFIDGTQSVPSDFGQYDSTGTFWTPKSAAEITALTFGNNGFYLPFSNSSDVGEDFSGNNNDLTNNNSVTTTTHTPTNLNALWNPLSTVGLTTRFPQLSVGNTTAGFSGSTSARAMLTLPVFYNTHLEFTVTQGSGSDTNYPFLQVFPYSTDDYNGDQLVNQSAAGGSGGTGLASGASIPNWTTGDRVTLEIDTTNGRIYVFIDGSAVNSANPSAGSGFTFDFTMPASGQLAIVWISQTSAGKTVVVSNPAEFTDSVSAGYFGLTSTIASAQTTRTKSNLEEYFSTTTYEGNGAGQRVGKFLPFTNTFTVANSALFNGTNNSLSRTQVAGTSAGTVWTFSAWIKKCENKNTVYVNWGTGGTQGQLGFDASGNFVIYDGSTTVGVASREFEDVSQWSHYHVAYNTGESGTDKVKLTINGVLITNWSTDNRSSANAFQNVGINGEVMIIGNNHQAGSDAISLNGYMAQVVFLDGTASAASNFGQLDTSTGRWIPSDLSSFSFGSGNNTVFLDFADSDALGDDESGQGHDFTNNNTVVQVGDTPTVNFATFNDTDIGSSFTLSNGNRTVVGSSATTFGTADTGLSFSKEKIFVMGLINDGASGAQVNTGMSICPDNFAQQNLGTNVGAYGNIQAYGSTIRVYQDSNGGITDGQGGDILVTHSIAPADGDYFTMAVDGNTGNIWFGLYDTSAGTHQYLPAAAGGTAGNPATGANPTITQRNFNNPTNHFGSPPTDRLVVTAGGFNTGSSITLITNSADMPMSMPTDYLEFKQDNLAEGESYQTAFSWIKNRDATDNHMLFDRVRGIYNDIHSNVAAAQVTNVNTLQRFLNGGIQVGNDVQVNTASESYVAWNWYMETAGSGSSNTDGDINTEATLVDTNLGLSISKFDSGANGDHTIGHGLGVVPEFVIFKDLESANNVAVYSSHAGFSDVQDYLLLNSTAGVADNGASIWGAAFPTSSVLGFTTGQINNANKDCVALCFAPSQFTAIGSYVGNGNANGAFIPTVNSLGVPIQPAWFMAKSTGSGQDWRVVDSKRSPFNVNSLHLRPNTTAADVSETNLDIDTGGIKIRTSSGGWNTSGTEYIYLAFGTPLIDVDGRIITGF